MSVQAMAAVFKLDLPPISKWVLMCLADNADNFGSNIFPTITTLSQKSSIPERTLQRHLKRLVQSGVIEVVRLAQRPTAERPGRGTEYRLAFMTKPFTNAPAPNYKSCPKKLRDEVILAFAQVCAYCGRQGNDKDPDGLSWEIDRIVPGSRGGSYAPENVALSCSRCNSHKGAKMAPIETPDLGAKRIEMGAKEFDTGAIPVDTGATAMSPDPSEEPLVDPSVEPSDANAQPQKKIKDLSDEEFLNRLETNPVYDGIDVRGLNSKMQIWCEVNGKRPTRRRLVNWLNRQERPMQNGNGNGTNQKRFESGAERSARNLRENAQYIRGLQKRSGEADSEDPIGVLTAGVRDGGVSRGR
jgi:5-methylcytosine-specific restriction endonuclease McrA